MIEANVLIAVIGCVVSVATFYLGRQAGARTEGRETGSLFTDMKHIKESVERIESRLNDHVTRLEGRIDEVSKQLNATTGTAARAHESSRSAHHRLNEHLRREHSMKVVDKDFGDD